MKIDFNVTAFFNNKAPKVGRLILGFSLASLVLAPVVRAAEHETHDFEQSTSEQLEKLQPLLNAKNWDGALDVLKTALSKVGPDTYDAAFINNIIAKLYLQKNEYGKVIPPWEDVLRLQDAHHYLDDKDIQDIVYFMAQIFYQEATTTKVPGLAEKDFNKATAYLERWMANTKKPPSDSSRQEAEIFYSSLLYNRAVINPAKIDFPLLHKAEAEIQKGLRMSPHPKEAFYQMLLAISQQENNYQRLSRLLEMLVVQYPQKKDYWSELENVYLNLAAQEKNEQKSREYSIRAILAIERAQHLGFLKTPKDNYTLVGIYFNIGQFGRATELLHAGLRDGSIDSELKNWQLLAYSYQQVDKPYEAIDVLREAGTHFPKEGELDYQIAQIYYSLNKSADAYKALLSATAKGNFAKPGGVYSFMSYVAWDLGKLDDALKAAEKALTYPDSKKDEQLPKLKKAIEDAIKERENTAKAAKASI